MTLKEIIQELKALALAGASIREVTFGDAAELDITTVTEFPLLHLTPVTISHQRGISTIGIQMTVVQQSDDRTEAKRLQALSDANLAFSDYINAVSKAKFVLDDGAVTTEVVYDQFANNLYGCSATMAVTTERDQSC